MLVELDEIKQYLRLDTDDDDGLLQGLMLAAQDMCLVIIRCGEEDVAEDEQPQVKTAILYAVCFLYEHRDEADHNAFLKTLRALLSGVRREAF